MLRILIACSAALSLISLSVRTASAEELPAPQSVQTTLFTPYTTTPVKVSGSGNYLNGDFGRIGYVPGRNAFVVTFGTTLSVTEGGCTPNLAGTIPAYAYEEYTAGTVSTGVPTSAGVISCHAMTDTGGLFVGDDFYLASGEPSQNNLQGWTVAKFNAVTWGTPSVEYYYEFTDSTMGGGDPMVAYVNGQIDFSGAYGSTATHHHFFTTALDHVIDRIFSYPPHFSFSSMISQDGVTNFLSSNGAMGDLIVMQYAPDWTYLGMKTLKKGGATPQGVASDGNRFYVGYTDASQRTSGCYCENVRLAAFDTSWNLIDDIAVTSHTLADNMSAIHPSVALKDNRVYIAYSQNAAGGGVNTLQIYVMAYDISTTPVCTSFTVSPTVVNASSSADSQTVTLTGVPSGCVARLWDAVANDSWLTVSSASGIGPGSLSLSWTQNTGTAPRVGTVTIAGTTLSVVQSESATMAPLLTATRAYDSTLGAIVNVSWTNPGSASSFGLERATNLGSFTSRATVGGTAYTDILGFGATANTLLYRVHESGGSQYSNVDYTTVLFFTDDPLVGGTTTVKAVHLSELRQAVDAMRSAANLSAATWTDSSLSGATVKAQHITELRSALTAAISAFSAATPVFTDSTLASGQTIDAAHFQQLRSAVK